MRYRHLSGIALGIFQFEFSPVEAFVDNFQKFVEVVSKVLNQNLVVLFQTNWHTWFP